MLKLVARVAMLVAMASPVAAQAVRTLPVDANDLAYSALTGRLYASVTATGSIVEIDPVAGTVVTSFPVGSTPNKLAVSDGGDYLFVGLDGVPAVVRVHLPTRTVGTPFQLGVPDSFFGPHAAEDIDVMPGSIDTIAVARRYLGTSPRHAGVAIYDSGVERATVTATHTGSNQIAFGTTAARLYGYNTETSEGGFRRMDVAPGGVTVLESTPFLQVGGGIKHQGGRIFGRSGRVIDGETRTGLTTLAPGTFVLDRIVEPTPSTVYVLARDVGTPVLFEYDRATLTFVTSRTIPGQEYWSSRALVSTGVDALAVAVSNGQTILLTPSLLVPPTAPSITITSPTSAPTLATESSSITLAGTAASTTGTVASVSWSSDRGYAGTANGTTAWTAGDIPLLLGVNQITVTATGSEGLTSSDTIAIGVAAFTAFLAEGATGPFFDYDLALANPSMNALNADITWFTQAGASVTQTVSLPAQSRRTIRVDEVPGLEDTTMSTSVRTTTTTPIVVERTMRWGQAPDPQYGAHTDKATTGTALKWYFAEGAQGFFYTYLLLANPGTTANTATIDWLIEGAPAIQRTVNLPPASRTTIAAAEEPALAGRSFGIVVTFAQPAVAERAMYFGVPPDVLFKAGHDSAGVTAPSTRWILAEGATGPFFETFILLANPNPSQVDVTLRFLTQSGTAVQRTVTVPALGRRTIDIEGLDPAAPELANEAVATVVTASQPIVVERAQYWPATRPTCCSPIRAWWRRT